MFVVDTNILIYAANRSCPEHSSCRKFLDNVYRKADLWFLTWGIIYEFFRVITHHRVLRKPWNLVDARRFIQVLQTSPGLKILVETERHDDMIRELLNETPSLQGNVIFDFHTAVLMKEHGIKKIYTRDTHFHKFKFLEVIDPGQ